MRRRRSSDKKEKAVMIASSVLVLGALTVTGLYIYQAGNTEPKEEYQVEMAQEEESSQELAGVHEADELEDLGELDYAPLEEELDLQQVGNSNVKNQQKTEKEERSAQEKEETQNSDAGQKEQALAEEDVLLKVGASGVVSGNDAAYLSDVEEQALEEEAQAEEEAEAQEALAEAENSPALHFSEETMLEWPIVGNILINYSMDKTVYFPTLDQYKYNPALIIAATQGSNITCAANGKVTAVYHDPEIGNAVETDLGDGYKLTYGQLTDITVREGDYITAGELLGKVAAPTKYYSVEGTNVYFKLTKDGEPVNPMNWLS